MKHWILFASSQSIKIIFYKTVYTTCLFLRNLTMLDTYGMNTYIIALILLRQTAYLLKNNSQFVHANKCLHDKNKTHISWL